MGHDVAAGGDDLVALRQVHVRLRGRVVLHQVNLVLGRGSVSLLGVNGAGKTTLMRVLVGQIRTTPNTVVCAGGPPTSQISRSRTGYLAQESQLSGSLTVVDTLAYAWWLKGGRTDDTARFEACLGMVGLSDRRSERVKRLSGGMRRRLSLAAAVVHDPDVLVLDEPMVGLDPVQRIHVRAIIRGLGQDRCVLSSTHQLGDVEHFPANRVIVLHEGRIRFDGTASALAATDLPSAVGDTPLERAFNTLVSRADEG